MAGAGITAQRSSDATVDRASQLVQALHEGERFGASGGPFI